MSHNNVEAQNSFAIAHMNECPPELGISIPLSTSDSVQANGYNSLAPFQPLPSLIATNEEMAKGLEAKDEDDSNIVFDSEFEEETYLDPYL